MTESEWLASNNVFMLLNHLALATPFWRRLVGVWSTKEFSERKMRLLACACVRSLWDCLPNGAARAAVEVAEQYADGTATKSQLLDARCWWSMRFEREGSQLRRAASLAGLLVAAEYISCDLQKLLMATGAAQALLLCEDTESIPYHEALETAAAQEVHFLRDIVGNPFHPVTLIPSWLTRRNGDIARLAQLIYADRCLPGGILKNDLLLVLADRLEDVGCDEESILNHLRDGSQHVRGCWALDLLLSNYRPLPISSTAGE
jgi:hypothetical protein